VAQDDEMVTWLRQQIEGDRALAVTAVRGMLPGYSWLYARQMVACNHGRTSHVIAERVAAEDGPHIARHAPRDSIADCDAKLALLALIETLPHLYLDDDPFYSCSQALNPRGDDDQPGCIDEGRAGRPCDCGRDRRVRRMTSILASGYRHRDGWKEEWAAA